MSSGNGHACKRNFVIWGTEIFRKETCRAIQKSVHGADGAKRTFLARVKPDQDEYQYTVN